MERLRIFLGTRSFSIEALKVDFFRRGIGLMFRTRETNNLLFVFSKSCRAAITAWFVFFPFWAVWLDESYRIVDAKLVSPFSFSVRPRAPARYLVEIPLNCKNAFVHRFLVGKTKRFK
jgi:uncharacterized membrane protein (UPF0127 family)